MIHVKEDKRVIAYRIKVLLQIVTLYFGIVFPCSVVFPGEHSAIWASAERVGREFFLDLREVSPAEWVVMNNN